MAITSVHTHPIGGRMVRARTVKGQPAEKHGLTGAERQEDGAAGCDGAQRRVVRCLPVVEHAVEVRTRHDDETAVVFIGVGEGRPHRHVEWWVESAIPIVLVEGDEALRVVIVGQLGDELGMGEGDVGPEHLHDGLEVRSIGDEPANGRALIAQLFANEKLRFGAWLGDGLRGAGTEAGFVLEQCRHLVLVGNQPEHHEPLPVVRSHLFIREKHGEMVDVGRGAAPIGNACSDRKVSAVRGSRLDWSLARIGPTGGSRPARWPGALLARRDPDGEWGPVASKKPPPTLTGGASPGASPGASTGAGRLLVWRGGCTEMFGRRSARRRNAALDAPFPDDWRTLLARRWPTWSQLSDDERRRLEDLVKVFLVDKRWEAANGFAITDEMRVLIAAMACLLVLERSYEEFRNVNWIVVSPGAVQERRAVGTGIGNVVTTGMAYSGLAEPDSGAVMIAWDAARYEARHPSRGENVVFHEFAHKLDMLDGVADGAPPMPGAAFAERWVEVCTREFERIRAGVGDGVLRDYAGVDPAEFFAVATETFFTVPHHLDAEHPELYMLLAEFYRQDPRRRVPE